jgi:hypothetical protein
LRGILTTQLGSQQIYAGILLGRTHMQPSLVCGFR